MAKAKIYTFTVIRVATEDFLDKVPYCSGIIEFENGDRRAVLIEGYTEGMDVHIGQEVECFGEGEDGLLKAAFIK